MKVFKISDFVKKNDKYVSKGRKFPTHNKNF